MVMYIAYNDDADDADAVPKIKLQRLDNANYQVVRDKHFNILTF